MPERDLNTTTPQPTPVRTDPNDDNPMSSHPVTDAARPAGGQQ